MSEGIALRQEQVSESEPSLPFVIYNIIKTASNTIQYHEPKVVTTMNHSHQPLSLAGGNLDHATFPSPGCAWLSSTRVPQHSRRAAMATHRAKVVGWRPEPATLPAFVAWVVAMVVWENQD